MHSNHDFSATKKKEIYMTDFHLISFSVLSSYFQQGVKKSRTDVSYDCHAEKFSYVPFMITNHFLHEIRKYEF